MRRRGSRLRNTAIPALTMSSTSVSSTWSPFQITNSGSTLEWTVSNGLTIAKRIVNEPTFDFSGNQGTADILVEKFDGLTLFNCGNLEVTELDITQNTALTTLYAFTNLLSSLNVSKNTELTILNFSTNEISEIDISNNAALLDLACPNNLLTQLDVSNNIALTDLHFATNSVTELDVSKNTELTFLNCKVNELSVLDLSNNTKLQNLFCYSNAISVLDISNNTALTGLYCYENNQAPAVTDQIFIDLDAHGNSNGELNLRNNRTSASDAARANLITKGWTIDDNYTS